MNPLRHLFFTLAFLAGVCVHAAALEVHVHVQDESTSDPIVEAYVRYLFNPGTAYSDTAAGYTDANGNVVLFHDLVSPVVDLPAWTVSAPYPNPAGHRVAFDISSVEKAGHDLEFELFDVRGRRIEQVRARGGTIDLDQPLAGGSYLYRVLDERTVRDSGKLIVLGRLERIDFKVVLSSAATKSGTDPVDILVQASGYEDHAESQELGDGQHFHTFAMTPSTTSRTLFGDAWDLLGENPLTGAAVHIRNSSGQMFSAPFDSAFSLQYEIATSAETLRIWFEHPAMAPSGALFDQDGSVVRGRVAQAAAFSSPDTMKVSAANPLLAGAVRYQAVDNTWNDSDTWHALLADGNFYSRGESRTGEDGAWRIEVLTRERNSSTGEYGSTITPQDLADFEFLASYKSGLLTGQPNGTRIADVDWISTDTASGQLDRAYWFIDDIWGPGNDHLTFGGDYLEIHQAYTKNLAPIGTKSEEVFGEDLRDVNGNLSVALHPSGDGQLSELGKAAFYAYHLFDHGTSFTGPPSGISMTLNGDAWDLLGENPLMGATVSIRNASNETFAASFDSSFSLRYIVSDPAEEIRIWFDHSMMSPSGVLFDRDGLVVRDRIAQAAAFSTPDTMVINADNALLTGNVRYQGVDLLWSEDADWRGLLAESHYYSRGEEFDDGAWTLQGWRTEYDSSAGTFGSRISPQDEDDITFLVHYKAGLLLSQPNGTRTAQVHAEVVDLPSAGSDRGFLYIDPTEGPGNFAAHMTGDILEIYMAQTPLLNPIGTKSAEFFGEELTDVNGSLAVALDHSGNGQLNSLGLAAFYAHYLFGHGTNFGY